MEINYCFGLMKRNCLIPFVNRTNRSVISTYEYLLYMIRNPQYFTYVSIPTEYGTRETYCYYLKYRKSLQNIKKIPDKIFNKEFCYLLIDHCFSNFSDIPKKYIDYDLCVHFVKNHVNCYSCTRNDGKCCHRISHILEEFKTYELYLIALKNCKYIYKLIPKDFLTNEMYYYFPIESIPDDKFNENMCLHFIQNNCSLTSIPIRFITRDLCLQVVAQNGY